MKSVHEILLPLSNYLVNFQDFQIEEPIYKNSLSDLFIVKHIPTSTQCLLKKLSDIQKNDHQHKLKFCREVTILSKCGNYFLTPLIGYTDTDPYCIITKHIKNGTLFNALHHSPGAPELTPTNKTMIAIGIANGMMSLHAMNIMHRDLKSLNILLDEEMLPRVSGLDSARFAKRESSLMDCDTISQKVGTTHWMAPEMFEMDSYTIKVDVYAYGILLWEILTEKIPFEGMNGLQVAMAVCNGQRNEIPNNAPEGLKYLIQICWANDPNERPSFEKVYEMLHSQNTFFPGTNNEAVTEFLKELDSNDVKFQHYDCNLNSITSSSSQVITNNEIPSTYLSILGDCNHIQFTDAFLMLINEITSANAKAFFDSIKPCFTFSTPPKIMSLMLSEIADLFKRDLSCVTPFIQADILSKMYFTDTQYLDSIYRILLGIAKVSPEAIPTSILSGLISISSMNMNKAISLFSVIASKAEFSPSCLPIIEVFLKHSELILTSDLAFQYIRILKYLLNHSKEFRQKDKQLCLMTLKRGTQSNNYQTSRNAYIALTGEYKEPEDIEIELVARHLYNPEIREFVLLMLYNMNVLPYSKSFIDSLIEIAPTNKLTMYILCKEAENPEAAQYLIKNTYWLDSKLSKSECLLVFMVIFASKENRQLITKMKDLPHFLLSVIQNGDYYELFTVSTIIRRLSLYPELVEQFIKEGIIEKFMSIALHSNEWNMINCGLLLIESFVRIKYSSTYLSIIPILPKLLNGHPQTSIIALSLSFILSFYKETHKTLLEKEIPQIIAKMTLPEDFEKYRNGLFDNLRKSKAIF